MVCPRVPCGGSQRYDDCLRMCVAHVLELHWRKVPNFVRKHGGRWEWYLWRWLKRRGLTLMKCRGEPDMWGAVPYIAVGPHRRGTDYHAVVMRCGRLVFDSNPIGLPLRRVQRSYVVLEEP